MNKTTAEDNTSALFVEVVREVAEPFRAKYNQEEKMPTVAELEELILERFAERPLTCEHTTIGQQEGRFVPAKNVDQLRAELRIDEAVPQTPFKRALGHLMYVRGLVWRRHVGGERHYFALNTQHTM